MSGDAAAGPHPWLRGVLSTEPFLIVAGGYRCGTTSLYASLAAHPQVNPSLIKEPAFFFSVRLRQQPPAYPPGHEAQAYLSLFRRRGAPVRMEATSNYLEDPGCAGRIAAALPAARVVIVLRDPVSRLVSWYRFLVMQQQLDPATGFAAWVEAQLDDRRIPSERDYLQQAVAHGHYAAAVGEYLRVLGPQRVHVAWFDDLRRDPAGCLRAICGFAGLDPAPYREAALRHENESASLARPRLFRAYRALHRPLLDALAFAPRLQFRVRAGYYGRIEARLLGLFMGPPAAVDVPPALKARLQRHYRSDLPALRALLGRDAPWRAEYEAA